MAKKGLLSQKKLEAVVWQKKLLTYRKKIGGSNLAKKSAYLAKKNWRQ